MLTVETLELERLDDRRVAVAWSGTASTSQLSAVLRVQGKTEITA